MSPGADPLRQNRSFCSSETARIHPQGHTITFATLALQPGTRPQRSEGIHVRVFSTSHELYFGRTTQNHQALSAPQGSPRLPLSQDPLGPPASPPALSSPISLPHRHTLVEGHTCTTHTYTLLTILHCQMKVPCGMPRSHPVSARMPGVLHGQPISAQLTFCVLSCQCVLFREGSCCLTGRSGAALAQDISRVSFSCVRHKSPGQQALCASSSFLSLPFFTGPSPSHQPRSCHSHVQHFHWLLHSATD